MTKKKKKQQHQQSNKQVTKNCTGWFTGLQCLRSFIPVCSIVVERMDVVIVMIVCRMCRGRTSRTRYTIVTDWWTYDLYTEYAVLLLKNTYRGTIRRIGRSISEVVASGVAIDRWIMGRIASKWNSILCQWSSVMLWRPIFVSSESEKVIHEVEHHKQWAQRTTKHLALRRPRFESEHIFHQQELGNS